MDGATAVAWRSSWSRLFDIAVICGAADTGYDGRSYRVLVQPYGAQLDWFTEETCMRDLQIAWAGSVAGKIYSKRRRLLPQLAAHYRMNDWRQNFPEDRVAPLYRRAQVVVNIQRDDCPRAYNLRCFEAFAAGALLFVEKASRLDAAGFCEGVHYVSYASDAELFAKLDHYLGDESARCSIAQAAQEFTRQQHTYDHRVAELFEAVEEVGQEKLLRASQLSAAEKDFLYCHYFSKRLDMERAGIYLDALIRSFSQLALPALLHFARARWHVTKSRTLRRTHEEEISREAGLSAASQHHAHS
jgi:hypothetical protein